MAEREGGGIGMSTFIETVHSAEPLVVDRTDEDRGYHIALVIDGGYFDFEDAKRSAEVWAKWLEQAVQEDGWKIDRIIEVKLVKAVT